MKMSESTPDTMCNLCIYFIKEQNKIDDILSSFITIKYKNY